MLKAGSFSTVIYILKVAKMKRNICVTMETVLAAVLLFCDVILRVGSVQLFLVRPQDTAVIKGQIAVMRCSIEHLAGLIQWSKDGLMLGYERDIPGYPRYSIISSNTREFFLEIQDVRLDDDSDYECQVSPAPDNPPLKASGHLRVLVPPNMPQILNHSNGSTVNVPFTQSVISLTCQAINGRPAAILKWYRNGLQLTEDIVYTTEDIPNDKRENAKSVITISPKYPDDNGALYMCEARNDALVNGPLQTVVKMSVQYPPGVPEITGYRKNQTARTNDTIQLICKSVGGNPLAQLRWFKNSEQVDFSYTQRDNVATNKLTFTAEPSDNDAEYRCEAWNVVNAVNHLKATRKLIVHFAPSNVTITGERLAKAGETVQLSCRSGNSNPAAIITWFARGMQLQQDQTRVEVSPDGGFVTISDIDVVLSNRQNTVMYTCQATNQDLALIATDTVTLSVLYPPDPPEIFGYFDGQNISAGTLQRMTCRASGGNPVATLQWYKGSEPMNSDQIRVGNMASAEVAIVAEADDNKAMYKCTATNEATDVPLEAIRVLNVHFPPASVRITSSPLVGRVGSNLTLTCVTSSSNPAANITWIRSNVIKNGTDRGTTDAENGGKSRTNSLVVDLKPADHGAIYSCRATNSYVVATVSDAITLSNIMFKPVFPPDWIPKQVDIKEGESRTINLTAKANPTEATYELRRSGTLLVPDSFTLTDGLLSISSINKDHGGEYIVMATNSEGNSNMSFLINVQYPPELTALSPVEGEAGASITLHCYASANPIVPNMITWTREGFEMTRTMSQQTGLNSSLTIEGLTKSDSGMFKCLGDNGIGDSPPAIADVELVVKFKPTIDKSPSYTKAASEAGLTGRLICKAEGAPIVTFRWADKDGVRIQADGIKYEIQEKVTDGIKYENILLIKDVTRQDYGTYQCIVSNERGEDRFPILFDDTAKPDFPYNIEFVNATHNSITLKWKAGFNGGLPQSFRVRYRIQRSEGGFVQVDVIPSESTIFTVKGLGLGTSYELTVMAFNKLGGSDYQPIGITATTSNLKPTGSDTGMGTDKVEDTPVIIILVICIVGIFLLALNIGLILFFVRRRRKRLENGSDTTSHTNTIELYGPSKETVLYPITPSDESRSYGTYDKNMEDEDDFSDDYKSYEHDSTPANKHESQERICVPDHSDKPNATSWKDNCCFSSGDEDLKRVFLPPPEYGSVTYSHNKLDSPTFEHRRPIHTDMEMNTERKSPWRYEDQYATRSKGSFDANHADRLRENSASGNIYEPNGRVMMKHDPGRPLSVTEMSERSSRSGGYKTPPPPPVRSSSKGAADIPPIPARNYAMSENQPRYVPPPGSLSSFNNNINVIPNPAYDGPIIRTPSPRTDPTDDLRGHLV